NHAVVPVGPSNPQVPGQPIDPSNPNGPKWPAGTDKDSVSQTIATELPNTGLRSERNKPDSTIWFALLASFSGLGIFSRRKKNK
ncbi:hypothetical protein IAP88_07135, partial [Fructobacillus fructosus]|nr:hypothetical protein [Fructobacillus fructosus]MBD9367042.1 hypothetical protein [Leuconostoc mesenteroides]